MVDPLMRCLLGACAALAGGAALAAALADPTRPPLAAPVAAPSAPASAAPGYLVQSIVFGPSRRLAVINGHQVHEGSALGEARVVQIQRDAVILEIQGQRRAMSMYASALRAPQAPLIRRSADAGAKAHD